MQVYLNTLLISYNSYNKLQSHIQPIKKLFKGIINFLFKNIYHPIIFRKNMVQKWITCRYFLI